MLIIVIMNVMIIKMRQMTTMIKMKMIEGNYSDR